ncbi:MAG: hypothetical protein JWQ52_291 [Phenylobacterium sp.]|nr:hypothetical protein [Phenylobacterium sp.]
MKRQRGRNRGGGGGTGGGGGGGKPQQQNANRAFDSNGPEGVKVRGNAQHVFEKYQQLARDAGAAGDRVLAENYLQHAEHYFRLLRAMQPQRPASEILGRDHFSSGFDIDFEDEGVQAQAEAADEAAAEAGDQPDGEARWQGQGEPRRDDRPRDDRPRDDRPRDDRPREGGQRDDRPRGDRFESRDGAPREGGQGGRRDRWRDRDDRPRDGAQREGGQRDDRPRDAGPRDDRPRGDRDERPRDGGPREDRPQRAERQDRAERDPLAVVEPQAQPLVTPEQRPSPVLRDSEGGESHAPAFLQTSTAPRPDAGDEEAPARKPRRRRAPRSFDGGEGAPPPSSETEEA